MGKLVAFSEFDNYLDELKSSSEYWNGTILDTNIIVSALYEIKSNHDEIIDFLDQKIFGNDIQCFTNVVTTAEFLNVYRRILLTEHLVDAVDEFSKLKLSKSSKYLIKTTYGRCKERYKNEKRDLIFSENELKKIRDTFSGGPHSGLLPWPQLVKSFLADDLLLAYKAYEELGIKYISPNEEDQKHFFHSTMEWERVVDISSSSALAIFDSMILNALSCSHFHYAISSDKDLAYATLSDSTVKDIVAPDSIVKEMKAYRFRNNG